MAAIALASFAVRANAPWQDEPLSPVPTLDELDDKRSVEEREQLTRRRALGRELFWSRRLSNAGAGDGSAGLSCGSCHMPEHWGASGTRYIADIHGKVAAFHVPSAFNASLNARQLWGGYERSMEAAANRALNRLMASPSPDIGQADPLMQRLSVAPSELSPGKTFRDLFMDAYAGTPLAPPPGKDVQRAALLDAIAEYLRTITPRNSVFDRWLRSEKTDADMKEAPQNGYRLFKAYGCVSCHQGVNVGGNMLAKFGVMNERDPDGLHVPEDETADSALRDVRRAGLATDTNKNNRKIFATTSDVGVFKVPSLRNVQHTAPYFHDGRIDKLEDAVRIMAFRQLDRRLTDSEVADIVAFLHTLTGEPEEMANKPQEMR